MNLLHCTLPAKRLGNDTVIGNLAAAPAGTPFQVDAAEIARLKAPLIQIVTQQSPGVRQDIQLGSFTLTANSKTTGIYTLAIDGSADQADITLSGVINGDFAGTFEIGGDGPVIDEKLSTGGKSDSITGKIETAKIDLENATLALKAKRIVFGNTVLLGEGSLKLSGSERVAKVASDLVSQASSSLYGQNFIQEKPFITAKRMLVTYTDFALFQNTGGPGNAKGVVLRNSTPPTFSADKPTLVLDARSATPSDDAFALFGTINGFVSRTAALLPETITKYSDGTGSARVVFITQPNSRINGCVIGSPDKGCLIIDVQPPALRMFDERQVAVFSTGDEDTRVTLDPLVGTNNEALIGDIAVPALNYEPPQCETDQTGRCKEESK